MTWLEQLPPETQALLANMMQYIMIAKVVFSIIALAKIAWMRKTFEKAWKPWWAAIIPFYNLYIMLKIIGKSWHRLRWILFPPVFLILAIIWTFKLAKVFGKSWWFWLWLVFFSFIFLPILWFGDAQYIWAKEEIIEA